MAWVHCLIACLMFHVVSSAIRMSQPKILLPFHPRIETNFTLEATDGCFLWSSSRPDLVRIDPVGPFQTKNGEQCSLHANVIAHTKQPLRASATVYARDIVTGQSVRCDVIIDKIQTIEIVYTTTRLYLEDAPELFKLRAHDQHGSTFSSIEHFSYEWRLLNAAIVDEQSTKKSASSTLDATKVIRILRLTDSSYEMSETVRNLESHGSLSYEILLEGLRTGSAFVQAELIDHDLYQNIRAKSVRLSVSANVQFHPSSDVYLLPYSRLPFRLHQIKRQEFTDITDLPSTRVLYEVNLINNDAGSLDDRTLIFTATDHADEQSWLELIDRNMKAIDNDTYEPTSLMIRIVNIGYLSAITNSTRPWIYQLGSHYLVTVELFDVNGRKIYPTDNLDLSALIPNEQHRTCLDLTSLHANGTQYILRPNCPGRFELEFRLNGMKNKDAIEIPLTATTRQWFEVYLPLTAQPRQVLLPEKTSIRETKTPHCPIKVLGGSGDYIFTSRDTNVVTVSPTGDLMVQTNLSSTTVDIYDKKSPELYTNVSVQVVQPDEFHLYPCPVETDLNSLLYLPIQLFYKKQPLTCCSHLDFEINIDNNVFQYQGLTAPSDDRTDQSCALIALKPLKVGLANLRVQLKKDNLQQSILLSAFEKLISNRDRLLLTSNAQYTLQLSHGPLNIHEHEPLKYDISPSDKPVRFKQDPSNSNLLHVKCLKPLEQTRFQISKQNPPSKLNRCPSQSTISLDVTCQASIHSLAFEPAITSQCPSVTRDYLVSYYDEVLPIKLVAYDEHQMPFDNFTSSKIDCSIKSKAHLADLRVTADRIEITPRQQAGRIILRCAVDRIEQRIEIEFLPPIQVPHPVKLIYINETSSPLTITGGSGYFKFQTNEAANNPLIKLSMNEKNSRIIFMQPLNYGRTTLLIVDQCLPLSNKKVDVIVADIDKLKMFGRSRMEFNRSSVIYLQAMDREGNLFNMTNIYPLMNIQSEQSQKPEILAIDYEPSSNQDEQTLAYRVQTLDLGRTNLRFGSIQARSNAIDFEVFPTLRIEPKQLHVLPLSTIQLTVHGGSQMPGTTIEWSTNDTKIVDIDTNSIFKTKQIGYAIVHAKSVGIDPLLGTSVVYGEDDCYIHVVQIDSIRLHTPTTEILPNKFLPFTVLPYDQNKNPIMITDVYLHSLSFVWSLSNTHLAQFRPLVGNLSSYTRTFVTNVESLRTGHVTVDVRVSAQSKSLYKLLFKTSHDLVHSVELVILEPFYVNQFDETRTILLGPNSRLDLFHIPNDVTLELSSSKTIALDTRTKTLVSEQAQYGEAILYMKYRGLKQDKRSSSASIVGAYLVQVKPVHYVLLQSYLPVEISALFSSIPVDYKLPLTVSYHDELGRRFDATSISLRTHSSRADMISSNFNNSQLFELIPLKNGSNVLVFDAGVDRLNAYLPVQSNSGLFLPTSNIAPLKQFYNIGDIVCFQSSLAEDETLRKDRWTGDDGMYVDSNYGIAQMIMDGERHLHLTIDGQTITSERFHVKIPSEINVSKGQQDFLFDGEQGKPSSYPVVLGADSKSNLHGSCYREGLEHAQSIRILRPTFECRLDFLNNTSKYPKASSLFKTQAIFDLDLMSWACQITSLPSKDNRPSSTHEDSLRLIVQTPYPSNANELIIPYQPSFQLSSSSSIYLSEEHPFQSIQISTLPSNEKYLQIQSSDPSIVRIKKNATDPLVYNVELRHGAKTNHQDQIYIDVKNSLTGQSQRVQIKVQKRFIDNPLGRILASLLLCASLALIVYGLATRKPSLPSTAPPMISKPVIATPRVIHSPPTPKRHLLFDDQAASPFDRNLADSPSSSMYHHQDQPVVRLYSAQDLRPRSIINTPRSAMSNMTLPTTDDDDLRRRLQRFREDN